MYKQGSYYGESQPRRYSPNDASSRGNGGPGPGDQYSVNDGRWYGGSNAGPRQSRTNDANSQQPYVTNRQQGPMGDLYGVVDRNRDVQPRSAGYENGAAVRQQPTSEIGAQSNQHVYELEHLATFSAASATANRLLSAPEGVRRVREMARAGAIWPLRVQIVITDSSVIVTDNRTGDQMEHFPLSLVVEPTSAMATDRRAAVGSEPLDNIVLFIVLEDPVSKTSPAEMHVFQCVGKSGQDFVDDILAAKAGKYSNVPDTRTQPYKPAKANEMSAYDSMVYAERAAVAASRYKAGPAASDEFRKSVRRAGLDPIGSLAASAASTAASQKEITQRAITLLDRCFSDIEQFVLRIQQAANAFNELDNRKSVRVNKNAQHLGDGLLGLRSRPPPARDFFDILQKFKLSFILLARLKAHIRDPNAPELVHFLFTPLALVVDASYSDTMSSGGSMAGELPARVVAPLLTPDAHDLLDNCLTSKESELLKSLGPPWNTSIDKWRWEIPAYLPKFYDGWQPPAFWMEEIGVPAGMATPIRQQSASTGQYHPESYGPANYDGGQIRSHESSITSAADQEMRNMELQRKLAEEYQRNRDYDLSGDVERMGLYNNRDRQMNRVPADRYRDKSPEWDRRTDTSANWDRARPGSRSQNGDQMVLNDRLYQPTGSNSDYGGGRFVAENGYPSDKMWSQKSYEPAAARQPPIVADKRGPAMGPPVQPSYGAQQDYMREPRAKSANVQKVICDREAKNAKELTVKAGEIVEVLDDQRNWWRVSNSSGVSGYVPKTILASYSPSG